MRGECFGVDSGHAKEIEQIRNRWKPLLIASENDNPLPKCTGGYRRFVRQNRSAACGCKPVKAGHTRLALGGWVKSGDVMSDNVKRGSSLSNSLLYLSLLLLVSGCDSSLVTEAREAEDDGRVIDNTLMQSMYPKSYRSGSPKYLERDFEAGANFICDQIRAEYDRDICTEPKMNWRR